MSPTYVERDENYHLKEELRKAEEERLRAIDEDSNRRHLELLQRAGLGPYPDIKLKFRPTHVSRIA